MNELQIAHQQYIDSCKGDGVTLMAYYSPCCQQLIETPAASEGSDRNGTAVCIHCGELYGRKVTHQTVDVWLPVSTDAPGKKTMSLKRG